jgi:hypothetical protein
MLQQSRARRALPLLCRTDIFHFMAFRWETSTRWLIALLLLIGFGWTLNLTLFNWWASSGPPVQHPEIYRMRGNIFFGISAALLLAFVVILRSAILKTRKRQ